MESVLDDCGVTSATFVGQPGCIMFSCRDFKQKGLVAMTYSSDHGIFYWVGICKMMSILGWHHHIFLAVVLIILLPVPF